MTLNSCPSSSTEKELRELLSSVSTGSSRDHKHKRIASLEELRRRIKSNSVRNIDNSIVVLLDVAKKQGHNRPESSLIVDSLSLLVKKYKEAFNKVLSGLRGREQQEEDLLFIVFPKLVLNLDHKKKRQAITALVCFLMTRDGVNHLGVREVYGCLVSLGDEKLSRVIVEKTSPYLDSFEICAIVFSVRLCSRFGGRELIPKMLEVLEKSTQGYFNGHYVEIERDLCTFLGRVGDQSSLFPLMNLLKLRSDGNYDHISKAIGAILDAHPYRVNDVLDMLYDQRDEKTVNAILQAFEKMGKKTVDPRGLLSKIRMKYWIAHPTKEYVHELLLRAGESSKPILFELLKDDQKYEFVLWCLKDIGVSIDELSKLFPKPPILQIYDFLYSQARSRKIPKDLNVLWMEKEKLRENVPGNTSKLEHLLLHIFSGFNFVTLNVAPLGLTSVDIVCFYPETLDLFIIGCTTGVLKDDLAKLDSLVMKMEMKMPNLFNVCTVTPVVVCSEVAAISPSDAKYSSEQSIAILQDHDIDKLLEMLSTNRESRQVLRYIEGCLLKYIDTSGDYYE